VRLPVVGRVVDDDVADAQVFTESDYSNNTAWVKFRLFTDSNGNRKVEVKAHSPCVMGSGLCGERSTNR
jgi:hypothetical protein